METDQLRSYDAKEMLTIWLKNSAKNIGTYYSSLFLHVSESL